MKISKTFLALYGGIALGFFALGILYMTLGKGKVDNSLVAILFSVSATLLATFVALSESRRKKSAGKEQCGENKRNKKDNDEAVATFYAS